MESIAAAAAALSDSQQHRLLHNLDLFWLQGGGRRGRAGENCPGISALRSIYDAVPVGVRRNLEAVYFVHPGLQARLFLATFGRLIFAGGLYEKIKYVNRVEFLWEEVRRKEVELPEFVHELDDRMERRPVMADSGSESDHLRLHHGLPFVDPATVSSYSMRCIA
ncbi:hypothetical protein NL676_025244 [Syzygium grande]|nr:hypothetical protein NL676_025244 [Syzygium grande]